MSLSSSTWPAPIELSRSQRVRKVILPAATPQIFAGLRVSLAVALLVMAFGEMFAGADGLGYFIVFAQETYAIPDMWSGIIMLGLVGYAVNLVFLMIERRVLRWHRGWRASTRDSRRSHVTPVLEVKSLSKTYGEGADAVRAIDELSFSVDAGEFVCIVGPSGCGKTTLLKCLSGLLRPTSGEAYLEGVRIDGPAERLALVFQEYSRSLLPWMTVQEERHASPSRATAPQTGARAPGRRGARGSRVLPSSPIDIRGSSRAACSSGWRSRVRSRTSRICS